MTTEKVVEVRLCDECRDKVVERIFAVCESNKDKSVEWWEKFWDKETDRQLRLYVEHCQEIGGHAVDR